MQLSVYQLLTDRELELESRRADGDELLRDYWTARAADLEHAIGGPLPGRTLRKGVFNVEYQPLRNALSEQGPRCWRGVQMFPQVEAAEAESGEYTRAITPNGTTTCRGGWKAGSKRLSPGSRVPG